MSVPAERECDHISTDLSEFALGILSGRDRSRVLEHVASCIRCRGELDALALVSDRLLELAPHYEPGVGFETRLVQRWHDETVRASRPRSGLFALVAAALIFVGGAFVVSTQLSSPTDPASANYGAALLSAPLTSHGQNHGQLWVSQGNPAWVFMSLSDLKGSASARCRVTLRSGEVLNLGTFSLVAGDGSWAARVSAPGDSLQLARITDANGRVLASATLTSQKI